MSNVRDRLIEATFQEVFAMGYNAASLANILKRADVKKGAMYHYFTSKKDMVLTMIEEKIDQRIELKWKELKKSDCDTIEFLSKIINDKDAWDLKNGCPLGNLLQESLDFDDDFIDVLSTILSKWKNTFIDALEKAKTEKQIKEDVNVKQCATFLIASIEGILLLVKKSKDDKDFEDAMAQLTIYLNSLRK